MVSFELSLLSSLSDAEPFDFDQHSTRSLSTQRIGNAGLARIVAHLPAYTSLQEILSVLALVSYVWVGGCCVLCVNAC